MTARLLDLRQSLAGRYTIDREIGRGGIRNADMSGTARILLPVERRDSTSPFVVPTLGMISPADSQTLVFTAGSDLFTRRLDVDSTSTRLAATPVDEMAARISPDGKWIAYAATGERAIEVFVQPLPPTGARYKVTDAGGMTPVWSPDSKSIFCVYGGAVHVADLRTEPDFGVTSRRRLFSGNYIMMVPPAANFDMTPDGKHLVLLRPISEGEHLIVAHNWKHELRARTGNRN